jgi:uncharacterized protein (TIGR03437 family)
VAVVSAAGEAIVRRDLAATDTWYWKTANLLVVTTAPFSQDAPNSILLLDPVKGTDLGKIAAGSDPAMLAASDDDRFLYVWLRGEGLIRRFDLQTRRSDLEFPAAIQGRTDSKPTDIKVVKGDPDTVAIAFDSRGIALFHGGKQLPDTVPSQTGCQSMTYGANPSSMWCQQSTSSGFLLYELKIDANGIRTTGPGLEGLAFGFNSKLFFDKGRLYTNLGMISEPLSRTVVGYFPIEVIAETFAIDPEARLVYFSQAEGWSRWISVMDMDRFTPVASGSIPLGIESGMIRCGAGGLAGVGAARGGGGSLGIVPLSDLSPLKTIPPGSVTDGPDGVRHLPIITDRMLYEPHSDRLIANTPTGLPETGNSIFTIDPKTLTPGPLTWIGSEPWAMAVTDSGHYLYQVLRGNIVRRLDLNTFLPDRDIPLYSEMGAPIGAEAILPLADSDDRFAVARMYLPPVYPQFEALAIYDAATAGPVGSAERYPAVDTMALSSSGLTLYGVDGTVDASTFSTHSITPTGLTPGTTLRLAEAVGPMTCDEDVCVYGHGGVIDGKRAQLLGECPVYSSTTPLPDVKNHRAYFLRLVGPQAQITTCDLTTFLPAESWSGDVDWEFPGNLLFWRPDQLAFNTGYEVVTVPKSAFKPIPLPSLPDPKTVGTHRLQSLVADAGIYDARRDRLYTTHIYNHAGMLGNSIAVIEPGTGRIEARMQMPGSPKMLALSSDSAFLWVQLKNAATVVRIDLASRTIVEKILLDEEPTAIAAVPGQPTSLAIAAERSLDIYDGGIRRPNGFRDICDAESMVFNNSGALILADYKGTTMTFRVSSEGITLSKKTVSSDMGDRIQRFGDMAYGEYGRGMDLETQAIVDVIAGARGITTDFDTNRIYGTGSQGLLLFDGSTKALISTYPMPRESWQIVPCGRAVAILGSDGVTLVPISAMTLVPHLPAKLSPGIDGTVRIDGVTAMAWDERTGELLVGLYGPAGPEGNSVIAINPKSGVLSHRVGVGSLPNTLSIARDSHTAYVGVAGGTGLIERVNLDTWAVERSWPIPPEIPYARLPSRIGPISSSTDSFFLVAGWTLSHDAIPTANSGSGNRLMILDNGLLRNGQAGVYSGDIKSYPSDSYAEGMYLSLGSFGYSPGYIGAYGGGLSSPVGISALVNTKVAWAASCGGRFFTGSGRVWSASTQQIVGDYGLPNPAPVACDAVNDRVYFARPNGGDTLLVAYRLTTMEEMGHMRLGLLPSDVVEISAAGPDYVALRTVWGKLILIPLSRLASTDADPVISGVRNAASWSDSGFARGSIISIFGNGLASWTDQAAGYPLPSKLADVAITIGGRIGYLLYVSDHQVNAIVPTAPSEGADKFVPGNQELILSVRGKTTKTMVNIVDVSPGLFNVIDGRRAAAQNEDYTLNLPANPARPGSVLSVYFTGGGLAWGTPSDGYPASGANKLRATTTATVGGHPAEILYSGLAPGFVGLAQANVRIPDIPDGEYELVLTVGGLPSNPGVVSVLR